VNSRAADHSQPDALAAMLALDEPAQRLWDPAELAAILRHQMAAPLAYDLTVAGPGPAESVARLSASPAGEIRTFSDLLHHPSPPIELLTYVKDFARAARNDPASPLPKEIAGVLYFAAIAVARDRHGRSITRLGEDAVREGVEWVLAQAWVDEQTRSVLKPRAG